jgi:pimeloyl-ACP methyl ester carboxylesterase
MTPGTIRTLRYLGSWLTGNGRVTSRQVTLKMGERPVPATWVVPHGAPRPLPAWVVLHGLTRTGLDHPQLVRFTRALAATGCSVLVPQVPEWVELELAPDRTVPTVATALAWLDARPEAAGTPRGLVGFSFGAPQAIAASGHPDLRDRLGGVVGFGGYYDLERTVRYQLTGLHEWDGTSYSNRPDPYGRWIVAGNHLTGIPGFEDHEDVAEALLDLAREAGDLGVMSWDASLDPARKRLRERVAPAHREAFDFLAPPDRSDPRGAEAESLARELARAALADNPEMDVTPRLGSVPGPVHILHGRDDHLIPFTEAWRLDRALPEDVARDVTVTALFGHSSQDPFPWSRGVQETTAFFRALARLLDVV